jgi:serine/threonine protein kinase/tetratricopeptide (TPR) repeat protein
VAGICPICGAEYEGADHECASSFIELAPARTRLLLGAGTVLGGTYRLDAPLAKGGMAVLWRAQHLRLDRPVAVKILRDTYADDPDTVARFRREAQTAGTIDHDNIVRVLDVNCEGDGSWYIAMELLAGTDVRALLKQTGPLPAERAVDIARQVCAGLAAAHARQIVHRDIKPSNVFLVDKGDGRDHAKLLDFGISKLIQENSSTTKVGLIIGTPQFMSPEQACGDPSLDHRTDIFSVGGLLYKMVTGHSPFESASPAAVLARLMTQAPHPFETWGVTVPDWLRAIILRCLARDPDARFWSALELSETLARHDETVPPPAPPPPPEHPSPDELRIVTVLFASLPLRVAPSDSSASGGAEGTGGTRDPRIARSREILRRHGAEYQRHFGDGLMAVFGAPSARGDDAVRAVRAALELRRLPVELDGDAAEIPVRVGLSTGRVVAGRMRGASTSGYGVVGQAVELARQIEGLGGPDSVVLCPETYLQVRGRFRVRPVGTRAARPGATGALVYEVLGEYPHGLLVPPREILGARAPMVGRDAELHRLLAAFRQAADERRPRAMTVVGPPGIGKSRLAYELRCVLEESGRETVTLFGQAHELTAGAPLQLWADLLRGKVGIHSDESHEDSARKLRVFVDETLDDTEDEVVEEVARALAVLLGVSDDAGLRQQPVVEQAGSVLLDLLRRISVVDPVVLVLDDLQWADAASLDALGWVLDRLGDCPVFVLGLARPELSETAPEHLRERAYHETFELAPLSRAATVQLVDRITGGGVPAALAALIAERSEGVPLFVEELLHGLAERGLLAREGRSWHPTGDLGTLEIPLTVEAVIQARLDRLTPEERDVLRKAAVIGETFWFGTLRALGLDVAARVLPRLCTREFIRLEPTSRFAGFLEYSFSHKLVRDTAYASLPPEERRRVHLAVGQWMEARGGDSLESRVLAARHFEAAEEWSRAAAAAFRAGELAHEMYAGRDARAHFETALRLAGQAKDSALAALARAGVGRSFARDGAFREALPHLEQALDDIVAAARPDQEWRCLQTLGQCYAAQGDQAKALQLIDLAADLTRRTGDRLGSAEVEKSRCILHYFAGRLDEAVVAARGAVALCREVKAPRELALNLSNVGTLETWRGREAEALAALRESTALARKHGIATLVGINQAFLGYLLVLGEKDPDGAEQIERSVKLARERWWSWDEVQELQLLGHARLLLGDKVAARTALERCVELALVLGERRILEDAGKLLRSLG